MSAVVVVRRKESQSSEELIMMGGTPSTGGEHEAGAKPNLFIKTRIFEIVRIIFLIILHSFIKT